MLVAAIILVVPLTIFTGVDRGWFESSEALGPRDVRVELTNFHVGASRSEISAGDVNLIVRHEKGRGHGSGTPGQTHDLVVMRMLDDGSTEVVARTGILRSGDEQTLRLKLAAGRYELLCDVVEDYHDHQIVHAAEGMRRTFTVTDAG